MKRRPSVLAVAIALITSVTMVLSVTTPVLADEYQYTVRVFPGNRGTLSADPVVKTVPKGSNVNLYDIATAKITDPKYVQTGFRLSGTDRVLGDGKINGIAEDMDFVVAYGVEASMVSYTLRFVEYQTGKELAEPKTYYGKAGDKPVAAYEYIEGYRPLYLAITGTLSADEENVWTFEYVELPEGETVVTTTTTTTTTYTTTPTTVTTTTAAAPTSTSGTTQTSSQTDENQTTGNEGAQGNEANATNEGAEEQEESEEPPTQEILDMDTPLAGPDSSNKSVGNEAIMLTTPAIVSGIAVIGCSAVLAAYFMAKRKKVKADEKKA